MLIFSFLTTIKVTFKLYFAIFLFIFVLNYLAVCDNLTFHKCFYYQSFITVHRYLMYVLYCTIFTHEIMNVNSALNFAICKKLFCKICLLFIPVSYNCKAILYFIFQRHCKEVLYNILILQDEKLSLR